MKRRAGQPPRRKWNDAFLAGCALPHYGQARRRHMAPTIAPSILNPAVAPPKAACSRTACGQSGRHPDRGLRSIWKLSTGNGGRGAAAQLRDLVHTKLNRDVAITESRPLNLSPAVAAPKKSGLRPRGSNACGQRGYHPHGDLRSRWKLLAANSARRWPQLPDVG